MSIFAQSVEQETTTDGQIPGGFIFASFKNKGSSPVTVNGATLQPGEAKSYPFVGKAYEDPVTYTLSGQTLQIMYIL